MLGRNNNRATRKGAATTTKSPQSTKSHTLIYSILRALQCLSAITSLVIFSIRLAKIVRLVHKASHSNGAVEGIIAAAVLYTLVAMALSLGLRGGGSNMLRILFVVLDVLFVGAFIAVAVLTSPKRHGSSGPCTSNARANGFLDRHLSDNVNCKLPWGTFILAIFSTLLHALTTAYHVAKDHRRTKYNDRISVKETHHTSADGFVDGNGAGYNGSRVTRV